MQSDDVLYRQYLSGDAGSYDALLLRYGDRLTSFLYGYLHSQEDAEDLMIEAFARIMVKKPLIREGGFRAYLYKTARHLAARFAVKQKRRRESVFREFLPEEIPGQAPAGGSSSGAASLFGDSAASAPELSFGTAQPEAQLLEKERNAALYRCLGRTSPEMREALWLFYMEDLSYEEAAGVMGVSRKKVDNLLSRGRMVLREELEKEGIRRGDL